MRLLKIDSSDRITLTEDLLDNIPPYAILSHTWGADQDECTFQDMQDGACRGKAGYQKIRFCGEQAQRDGLEHFWVDSVCINKANYAELSEAINSMFRWYRQAQKCYVYLADVSSHKRDRDGETQHSWKSAFRNSRWFTRGWTLQELLAPEVVEFYSREGDLLGSKRSLHDRIQEITGVPASALGDAALSTFTVAERMKWAANRSTKRIEDKVYCLLGIFDVFMSPIYGEGDHASVRLKDAIARSYRDQLDKGGLEPSGSRSSSTQLPVAERRAELVASLRFDQMDSRRATIKKAYSNTCQWILSHPSYLSWIDQEKFDLHHGFLWINGKPGAGKSTLIKCIHANAEKSKAEDEIILSFFFNARGEELEKSTIGMYRALLSQLFEKVVDLQEILDQARFRSQNSNSETMWETQILRELLSLCLLRLSGRHVKCFIDALDECDEDQVRDMIEFWEELGQIASECNNQIHVCLSSRHYPAIDIRHGCQLILEDQSGHTDDLAKYVKSHLHAGKGQYAEEIKTLVTEKANGVFMWAVLVVDILNKEFSRGRIFAVKKRLQEIPEKLSDLFKDLLRRDSSNMGDMLLCLQWILFARRPLSREEFYFAMVSGLDPEPENLAEWNPDLISVEDMNRFVLNASKGLAETTRAKRPLVQFIHESVRDFLLKENGLSELWPEMGPHFYAASHEELKRCCRNYLDWNALSYLAEDAANSQAAKDLRQQLTATLPFLEYASRNLLYHADEAAQHVSQEQFLHDLAMEPLLNAMNLFERYDVRRNGPTTSMIYLLAEHNCARLLKTIVIKRPNSFHVHSWEGRYEFPIFASLAKGHHEAVKAMLSSKNRIGAEDIAESIRLYRACPPRKGISPLVWALETCQRSLSEALVTSFDLDLDVDHRRHRTALSYAAESGFESVFTALLKVAIKDINTTDESLRAPLSYAAESGFGPGVSLLLKHDAWWGRDHSGRSPLIYATERGHVDVVTQLLDHGCHVEESAPFTQHLLERAASSGQASVMQLLLDRGANTYTGANAADTVLSRAIKSGNASAVRLLFEHHASLDACKAEVGEAGDLSPLLLAATEGHNEVIQILLENGAEIEARGDHSDTPLMRAISNGRGSTVELLLRHGAYVEDIDSCFDTAIFHAITRDVDGLAFERLLSSPANIDAVDQYGATPLIHAAKSNRATVMRILLSKGALVDAQDESGRTALSHSSAQSDKELVELLIEAGANVSHADNQGITPLMWAMTDFTFRLSEWGGFHETVVLSIMHTLLDNGAPLDARSNEGKTALSIASQKRTPALVSLLEEYR